MRNSVPLKKKKNINVAYINLVVGAFFDMWL